ncbi:MAG TPA: hypothetical protein VGE81_07280 [Candidatus Limnocylindrales bacterium]|jgi:hypothetical protein
MNESPKKPVRRRPDWRAPFLDAIRVSGNVKLATNAAGIDRSTPYRRAGRDPAFAEAWTAAEQDAIDTLEGEARRRALQGSDGLLMFLLRAHRPERYRDSIDVRLDVRREAERIAAKLGMSAEEVLEIAERRAREMEHR